MDRRAPRGGRHHGINRSRWRFTLNAVVERLTMLGENAGRWLLAFTERFGPEAAPVESFMDENSEREYFANFVQYERLYGRARTRMTPFAPILTYRNRARRWPVWCDPSSQVWSTCSTRSRWRAISSPDARKRCPSDRCDVGLW